MEPFHDFRKAGVFTVGLGHEVPGELTLRGEQTALQLYSQERINPLGEDGCILGTLHDRTRVSLIKCVTLKDSAVVVRNGERFHSSSVFPHAVILGSEHLAADDRKIVGVVFEIGDAYKLFDDPPAFGGVVGDYSIMASIAAASGSNRREIPWGSLPLIFYATGKSEIFKAETAIGTIVARHSPTIDSPGTRGIRVANKIPLHVTFDAPKTVSDAIGAISLLMRYLLILAGRPQNITRLDFLSQAESGRTTSLNVYWSLERPINDENEDSGLEPIDIPVQAAQEPERFAKILTKWIARDDEWREARTRFASGFKKRSYTIDRLVAAANMFDILPPSAAPKDVQLSAELEEAKEKATELFKGLEKSIERDSVLSALGRLGKASLKRKILSRTAPIIHWAESKFPQLDFVMGEAVNCRNHFVHGSEAKLDYLRNFDHVIFFTNALEFVFAASDLVDCGWNISMWSQKYSGLSHPFDRFLKSYESELNALKRALALAKEVTTPKLS